MQLVSITTSMPHGIDLYYKRQFAIFYFCDIFAVAVAKEISMSEETVPMKYVVFEFLKEDGKTVLFTERIPLPGPLYNTVVNGHARNFDATCDDRGLGHYTLVRVRSEETPPVLVMMPAEEVRPVHGADSIH